MRRPGDPKVSRPLETTGAREVPRWEDPRRALARHGFAPKRSFSQNFLVAEGVVERIAGEATRGLDGRTLVELGPGVGTLTSALLRRGAQVVAVERDRDMASALRADLGAIPEFALVEADAARVDLGALSASPARPVAVAGNLPYAITGAILRALHDQSAAVAYAVVMVQREVRDRLLASPGDKAYGALTVFTSNVFDVTPVIAVRPGAFFPPPKVASAVVRLDARPAPRTVETPAFTALVRAVFAQRRKTLRNAAGAVFAPREAVAAGLDAAGVDPARRGETLGVEELGALATALDKAGAHRVTREAGSG